MGNAGVVAGIMAEVALTVADCSIGAILVPKVVAKIWLCVEQAIKKGEKPEPTRDEIQKWCSEQGLEEAYCATIVDAVAKYLSDFDLLQSTFDAQEDGETIATNCGLTADVVPVLSELIRGLQQKSEKDSEFQVKWKAYCQKRFANHESRISSLEEQQNSSVDGLANEMESYQDEWDRWLFLDNRTDQHPVTLGEVHQLSHYNNGRSDLQEKLNKVLDGNEMLVVLGLPGIGKSSLITYLLNNCTLPKTKTIYVHKFTEFQKKNPELNWDDSHSELLAQMLTTLGRNKKEELQNSVLILDGLDEINMQQNHVNFLNALYLGWVGTARRPKIPNFSLIVTCRRNRIEEPNQIHSDCITLCSLNEEQIDTFAEEYFSAKGLLDEEREQRKQALQTALAEKEALKEVLGIPIILYMTLALNVPIGDCQGLEDLYHRIFSTTNRDSVYWRGYDNNNAVNEGSIQRIHDFSKAVAVTMWDKNPSEATVKRDTAEKLAEAQAQGQTLTHLLTGQYFIEGKEGTELLFVHRSMYEYFTALSLFDAIQAVYNEVDCAGNMGKYFQQANEGNPFDCLTKLANVLGIGNLNEFPDIKAYLLQMLERVKKDKQKKQSKPASWWTSLLDNFLEHGLLPSVKGRAKGGERGLEEEGCRFANLLWLVKEQFRILEKPAPYRISGRLSQSAFWNLPHGGLDLREVDLREVNLCGANLIGADLRGADLRESYLHEADLCGAILYRANLCEANLCGANLIGADLRGADLCGAKLHEAKLRGTKAYPDTFRDAYGFTRGQLAAVQWFEPQTNTVITDRTYIIAILDSYFPPSTNQETIEE